MSTATPSSDSTSAPSLIHSRELKLVFFSNEFPHDDRKTLLRRLIAHSKGKQYPILAHFIHEATVALREEVRQLPAPLRELIPHFECIFDLADEAKLIKGPFACSIDEVLLCAVQLAIFIGYYEDGNDNYDFHSVDACLAGLGAGLLMTAAVSLAPTLGDIPIIGAEVIRVAFRLVVLVDQVSQNLQPKPVEGTGDSWAYIVPGVGAEDAQKELDAFHAVEVCCLLSKSTLFTPPSIIIPILCQTASNMKHLAHARGQQNLHQRHKPHLSHCQWPTSTAQAPLLCLQLLSQPRLVGDAGIRRPRPRSPRIHLCACRPNREHSINGAAGRALPA